MYFIAEGGWTPLLIATANGHIETVKYLLQKAVDPDIANKLGASPLLYAAWYGNELNCKILINLWCYVNQQDMQGHTPLIKVAIRGHSAVAKFLFESGANAELLDGNQKTVLSYAEEGKYDDIARLLRKS